MVIRALGPILSCKRYESIVKTGSMRVEKPILLDPCRCFSDRNALYKISPVFRNKNLGDFAKCSWLYEWEILLPAVARTRILSRLSRTISRNTVYKEDGKIATAMRPVDQRDPAFFHTVSRIRPVEVVFRLTAGLLFLLRKPKARPIALAE